jgi:protein-L-isoaspartate O-methyltransferase
LIVLAAVLAAAAPVLFLAGFLCFDGFVLATAYYAGILGLAISIGAVQAPKRVVLDGLLALQVVFVAAAPIGMLLRSMNHGGVPFFLSERIYQYIYLEGSALFTLYFCSSLYAKETRLNAGKLTVNLVSPLSLVLLVTIALLIVFALTHLFPNHAPALPAYAAYVCLVSVPLLAAVFILGLHRILIGYIVGFTVSLVHLVHTPLLLRQETVRGSEAAVFLIVVFALGFFSVRGIMEYHFHNNRRLPRIGFLIMRTMLKIKGLVNNVAKVLHRAGVKENMKVLDFGCGIGNFSLAAAKTVGNRGKVICADGNEKMLEVLDKRRKAAGLENLGLLLVDTPAEVAESNFDFIFLIDVLQLVENKKALVESLVEKLADGGRILVKFEHFSKEQIDVLMKDIRCTFKKKLFGTYRLIGR